MKKTTSMSYGLMVPDGEYKGQLLAGDAEDYLPYIPPFEDSLEDYVTANIMHAVRFDSREQAILKSYLYKSLGFELQPVEIATVTTDEQSNEQQIVSSMEDYVLVVEGETDKYLTVTGTGVSALDSPQKWVIVDSLRNAMFFSSLEHAEGSKESIKRDGITEPLVVRSVTTEYRIDQASVVDIDDLDSLCADYDGKGESIRKRVREAVRHLKEKSKN